MPTNLLEALPIAGTLSDFFTHPKDARGGGVSNLAIIRIIADFFVMYKYNSSLVRLVLGLDAAITLYQLSESEKTLQQSRRELIEDLDLVANDITKNHALRKLSALDQKKPNNCNNHTSEPATMAYVSQKRAYNSNYHTGTAANYTGLLKQEK